MQYDEARLKHRVLMAHRHEIEQRAEWEQLCRLERLQKSIQVVRARLGLRVATE
jgi:hypothetical protein